MPVISSSQPRLYVGPERFERLRTPAQNFPRAAADQLLAALAEQYCASAVADYPVETHNALLIRGRMTQTRIVTLLVRWRQTGDPRFRAACLAHLREMAAWQYWSWISMRQGDARPEAYFDLSYGENATTLALAWDWLGDSLNSDERELILGMVRRWVVEPFLENTSRAKPPFWYQSAHSNWNTVCSGGAGMVALAMYEQFPTDAAEILRRVEVSIEPYIDMLAATAGGWEEGVGYWNYGMRYAFMYLLSWERATNQLHPFMTRPGVAETIDFPVDFSPFGIGCGFGDANNWKPLPFHYALAERYQRADLVQTLDSCLQATGVANSTWPDVAELLLLYPDVGPDLPAATSSTAPYAKRYPTLDWYVLADQWPCPHMYLAIRGGSTEVAHGHVDLLTFHAVVDGEQLLTHARNGGYNDVTFSSRRNELYDITPQAKNSFLINGVGVTKPASVTSELLELGSVHGVRLDATTAMGVMRDGPVARFAARLILRLNQNLALVIDRAWLQQYGRLESRLHTLADINFGPAAANLNGKRAKLNLRFAADVDATLHHAIDPLTNPGPIYHMLRWCSDKEVAAGTLATLISRDPTGSVTISGTPADQQQVIAVVAGHQLWQVKLDKQLKVTELTLP